MAPYPENDKTPKAPDKSEKSKSKRAESQPQEAHNLSETNTKEASVSGLDDGQLKALLDEAVNYKNPKDREGKSDLFKNLLNQAEDDLRNARATSASGSELVRYYNTSASKRNRHKRQPSSISENLTHGGSLNNLAKEELYETAYHLQRPKKTVSARQREGGSLPCNVNVGGLYDPQVFVEEARRKKEAPKAEYPSKEMDEKSLLLEHDSLNQNYSEGNYTEVEAAQNSITKNYTTKASLQISNVNVDDCVNFSQIEHEDKNSDNDLSLHLPEFSGTQQYSLLVPGAAHSHPWPIFKPIDNKKVDENGNALGHGSDVKKNKKKKRESDKNVREFCAKDIAGHRSDIIHDVDKLLNFIDGNENSTGAKPKSNVHKSKLHKHVSTEEKGSQKKHRTRSKGKGNLQKSTSMEEMSTSKLEDFNFTQDDDIKVPLRPTKSNAERPRERRSWGNTEQLQLQNVSLYANASAENLETADFRVVTKKKKSKKRRNSLSGRRQPYSRDSQSGDYNRLPSPDLRKSACSVPHSEKSDSSDVDSVHSLPIDTRLEHENLKPYSYADIAKNSSLERTKWNNKPVERKKEEKIPERTAKATTPEVTAEKVPSSNKESPEASAKTEGVEKVSTKPKLQAVQNSQPISVNSSNPTEKVPSVVQNATPPTQQTVLAKTSPELTYNQQNWPSIQNNNRATAAAASVVPNNGEKVCNKGVQSSNKVCKNNLNNIKNLKNAQCNTSKPEKGQNGGNTGVKSHPILNNINVHQVIHNNNNEAPSQMAYPYNQHPAVPVNIPDVQSIEKMQLKPQHFKQYYPTMNNVEVNHVLNNSMGQLRVAGRDESTPRSPTAHTQGNATVEVGKNSSDICDSERTRPPVVILSGDDRKEVSDITFGFDINEQLLTGEVCSDFISRFVVPEVSSAYECNHDKIVHFISTAWEEVLSDSSGKVQYYSDL